MLEQWLIAILKPNIAQFEALGDGRQRRFIGVINDGQRQQGLQALAGLLEGVDLSPHTQGAPQRPHQPHRQDQASGQSTRRHLTAHDKPGTEKDDANDHQLRKIMANAINPAIDIGAELADFRGGALQPLVPAQHEVFHHHCLNGMNPGKDLEQKARAAILLPNLACTQQAAVACVARHDEDDDQNDRERINHQDATNQADQDQEQRDKGQIQ
nr:hypothetical protein [Lamprobacter modestohalophilus]